jgi:hypothetical protein
MELKIHELNKHKIAEVMADEVVVQTIQDALDLIVAATYEGAGSVIIAEQQLNGDFFDLRTRLAGGILQKCANYRVKLAVVGDFEKYPSASLHAFIMECNRGRGQPVVFVPDTASALAKLGAG